MAALAPLGGPAAGGTRVAVTVGDGYETLSPLTDLGGSRHGLYCHFADSNGWQARVAGSSSAGGDAVVCDSPAYATGGLPHGVSVDREFTGGLYSTESPPQTTLHAAGLSGRDSWRLTGELPLESHRGLDSWKIVPEPRRQRCELDSCLVTVEVTLNGQDYTNSSSEFRFYDARVWRVRSMHPHGGPVAGGTTVTVHAAAGVRPVGALRCLFGGARPVPATAVSASDGSGGLSFRCDSPRARLRQAHGEAVELMLSVNDGQQYLRGDSAMFTYFPVAPVNGLSVTGIRPLGGPSAGGTLVHLRGARLANLGGQVSDHAYPLPALITTLTYWPPTTSYHLWPPLATSDLTSYSSAALPVLDVARALARNLGRVRAPHVPRPEAADALDPAHLHGGGVQEHLDPRARERQWCPG